MKAIILSGGKGTRLGEITRDTPKPLIQINGKPFLEHQLALIKDQEIREILLLVGYCADKIESYFGDGKEIGLNIDVN